MAIKNVKVDLNVDGDVTSDAHITAGGLLTEFVKGTGVLQLPSAIDLSDFNDDLVYLDSVNPTSPILSTISGGNLLNISHSTAIGNKHIPSGGASGNYLGWVSSGLAAWSTPPNDNDNNYISNVTQTAGVLDFTGVGSAYNSTVDLKTYFDTQYNNYSLPLATNVLRGGIELFSNTDNPTAANSVTSTAGRTYGLQLNSSNQGVINIPWTDTDNDHYLTGVNTSDLGNVDFTVVGTAGVQNIDFRPAWSDITGASPYVTSVTATGAAISSSGGTTPNILHLTTEGYKHIPSGGTVGQILKNIALGTVGWDDYDSITSLVADDGITITNASGPIATIKAQGLEQLDEGNGTGFRLIDYPTANFGNIGVKAINLSWNSTTSSTHGSTGAYSFTAGFATTASGAQSFAAGQASQAIGDSSFAAGVGAKALNAGSIALGNWNVGTSTSSVLEVGMGGSDGSRLNIFEIDTSGRSFSPQLTIALIDGQSASSRVLITKEWIEDQHFGGGSGIVESLTTTGTSGVATLITGVLNVPNYTYTLPAATTTVRGGIELESATVGNAANAITNTASRTYGLQINSSGQGVINVPWTDNNDNDNDFVTGASFNDGTGVITLTISNQTPVTVDIDGRYSTQTLTASEGVTLSSNDIQMNILNLTEGTSNDSADSMVYYDATAGRHVQDVMSDISLSQFDNDSNWTSNTGTVTSVTVGTGLDIANGTTTPLISVDLSEFTAIADNVLTTADYMMVLDGTTERKITFTNMKLSLFQNDSAWTSYAEPGIFSGGGVPTLATGVTGAEIRTLIGAGTSSTTGTVTSVGTTGTVSGITLSGTVTTSGNLTLGGTLSVLPSNFSSQTAKTFLAAPNASAGVPTFRLIAASDIPTLNQSTTGNASTATTLATGRTIGMTGDVVWTSASFNGSGNVTGTSTIQTDAVDIAMLSATGTASSSTYLRGDNTWATVSSGGVTDVIGGAGLTDSTVTTTITLNVGQGDGLDVNANDVAVSYDGSKSTNVIESAFVVNATNPVPLAADTIIFNKDTDSKVYEATLNSINVSLFTNDAGYGVGDITAVVAGSGMIGGASSASATLNVIGSTGITANADNIAIDYAGTDSFVYGAATLTNPATTDYMNYYDVSTSLVKKTLLSGIAVKNLNDSNVIYDNVVADYTRQQGFAALGNSHGGTTTLDMNVHQVYIMTLGSNVTLNIPSNISAGNTYILVVIQGGGGETITWNSSNYLWPGGTTPVLSTGAGEIDVISFVALDSSKLLGTVANNFK